jgi:hypothetical protein
MVVQLAKSVRENKRHVAEGVLLIRESETSVIRRAGLANF